MPSLPVRVFKAVYLYLIFSGFARGAGEIFFLSISPLAIRCKNHWPDKDIAKVFEVILRTWDIKFHYHKVKTLVFEWDNRHCENLAVVQIPFTRFDSWLL